MDDQGFKKFQDTLSTDTTIAKFTAKKADEPSIAAIIENVRTYAQQIVDACDQALKIVNTGVDADQRALTDVVLNMMKKIR